jgi:hypothetical protein
MGKHMLANAHIAMLNELTVSEVTELTSSMVDETALAILKRQGSWEITMVSLQRQIIFDIQVNPYWPKWYTKRSKLAPRDFESFEFHQDTWNCYIMLVFVLVYIPYNLRSNLELCWSHQALHDDQVLPSITALNNICWRQYALTVDAIEKQLPLRNKASWGLDGWTSTNKLVITSGIAYNMERHWALQEAQCAFDEVDCLFFATFES